ncbi:MAG: GntR family transcriptional regulator [Firmicutes bacterium]|nr:GntR family transcriptional regulator [Bacillota bacterium]
MRSLHSYASYALIPSDGSRKGRCVLKDPLFKQIAKALQCDIANHPEWVRLPGEGELADQFGVGTSTIKRALQELVEADIIVRSPGKGTFVRERVSATGMIGPRDPVKREDRLVGVVLPGVNDPFAMGLLQGIITALHQEGWQALVGLTEDRQELEAEVIATMRRRGVDGLLVFPAEGEMYNDEILRLKVDRVPFILIDRDLPGVAVPCVSANHRQVAEEATRFLIEQNHQSVAFIAISSQYPWSTSSVVQRIEGFRQVMEPRVGDTADYIWTRDIIETPSTGWVGWLAARLSQGGVSAALCNSIGDVALLMKALAMLNVSCPAQFSLVGFDYGLCPEAVAGAYWVDQHVSAIGATAAEYLRMMLDGNAVEKAITVPAELKRIASAGVDATEVTARVHPDASVI